MKRRLLMILCLLTLNGCAVSPATQSELAQGKRLFDGGYYKSAMKLLLPLAANGNPDAEYAVGYMVYYGYGATQDTDTGYFWIKRAADQKFQPAVNALKLLHTPDSH